MRVLRNSTEIEGGDPGGFIDFLKYTREPFVKVYRDFTQAPPISKPGSATVLDPELSLKMFVGFLVLVRQKQSSGTIQ